MITAAFSGIVSGIFYSFTGHHLDKILTGGSNAFLIGFVTGPFMGLAVDSYKRLFGIPSLTRRRIFYNEINAISPIKRKTLGALITGTSIYATSCIYSYLPYEFHHDTPLRKEPIKSESFSLESKVNSPIGFFYNGNFQDIDNCIVYSLRSGSSL